METWCWAINNSSQGGVLLYKVLYGEANTFTLQHTIFDKKDTLFEYLTQGY